MTQYNVAKVTSVPGTLAANTIYLVTDSGNASYLEVYVTDNNGSAHRRTPTRTDIQSMIDSAVAGLHNIEIVSDIAARNALTVSGNTRVLVLDASADSTVVSGAAEYVTSDNGTTWVKISEAESMDLTVSWSDIVGRPSSTPSQIDSAVTNSHTHSNKTQLDQIGQNAQGGLTYNGTSYVSSATPSW